MKTKILPGKDGTVEDIFSLFDSLDFIEVEAGYLNPNNTHPRTDTPLTDIAYLQQNGSDRHMIPERPFLSDGAVLSEKGIQESLHKVMFNYLKLKAGLSAFAPIEKISRESIARAIAEQKFVPLSPKTIKIRRDHGSSSDKILIDEGYLINGIETKVTRRRSKKS